jgi:peptidoglycan/LPS O-acetylase OafA/YrhL
MIGIVWAHVVVWPYNKNGATNLFEDSYMQAYIPFKQVFKFAVICFFMISGFLLGDKITSVNGFVYFKKRFNNIIRPFLVAFLSFLGLLMIRKYVLDRQVTESNSFGSIVEYCVFGTPFWYVPNYLVCLSIILAFRKYLQSWYFGTVLFCITLIYTFLTVYNATYASAHTTALLGFVFYLWLGAYIRQKGIINNILKAKTSILLTITVLLFVLSSIESYWLYKHALQYENILRMFNQLYSVAMFALLVKLGSSNINYGIFEPRKESFGIYLYHCFFIYFVFPKGIILIKKYLGIEIWSAQTIPRLLLVTLYAVCCYLLTVMVVKILLRFKLAYL